MKENVSGCFFLNTVYIELNCTELIGQLLESIYIFTDLRTVGLSNNIIAYDLQCHWNYLPSKATISLRRIKAISPQP